ncbi:hypothetical protein [Streptomyces sp. SM1]|uniref:hypothetical protein n=1 Tax=Streptomyces sp. SM1 TaxID=402229 RepID=UPI000CD526CA|nr:hypothetical protein [Streptomyces sp. SM1]
MHAVPQAALAALGVPWAKAASVPSQPDNPDATVDLPVQPALSDARGQEHHGRGDTAAEGGRQTQAARGTERMSGLMRNHTKAELLRMAYAGGLVNHNSPEK